VYHRSFSSCQRQDCAARPWAASSGLASLAPVCSRQTGRTCESRDQNPLPYRLATAQSKPRPTVRSHPANGRIAHPVHGLRPFGACAARSPNPLPADWCAVRPWAASSGLASLAPVCSRQTGRTCESRDQNPCSAATGLTAWLRPG